MTNNLLFSAKQLATTNAAVIISLTGPIDNKTTQFFEKKMMKMFSKGYTIFIMDMEKVTSVSLASVGIIVKISEQLKKRGGGLALVKLHPKYKSDLFDVLGMDIILKFLNDEKEAFAHFGLMSTSTAATALTSVQDIQQQLDDLISLLGTPLHQKKYFWSPVGECLDNFERLLDQKLVRIKMWREGESEVFIDSPHLDKIFVNFVMVDFLPAMIQLETGDILTLDSEGEAVPYIYSGEESLVVEVQDGHYLVNGQSYGMCVSSFENLKQIPFEELTYVDIEQQLTPKIADWLTSFCTSLQILKLRSAEDSDLENLQKLPGLQFLDLERADVSDEGILHIQNLQNLRILDMGATNVSDAGLAHLQEMKGLRVLDLGETEVSDKGGEYLRKLKTLRVLDLGDTEISDASIQHLVELKSLRLLSIWSTQITDSGMEKLAQLTNLRVLDLGFTDIGDKGIVHLRKLQNLRVLALSATQVGDIGIGHLVELKNLQLLSLENTNISDKGMAHLFELKNLKHLDLGGAKIGDKGIEYLAELKKLRLLSLWKAEITNTGLNHLAELKNLRLLSLAGTKIDKKGLSHLENLKKLRMLSLEGTDIKQEDIGEISEALPDCKILV